MPPKKLHTQAEEVDDIKRSLDMLTEEVSAVRQQRLQNIEKDKRIMLLENRVVDLEQYTRMNDIMVTGLEPRSYAPALTTLNEGETNEQDDTSVEQHVTAFLRSKGTELDREI
ncbi:hypothetical protein M9458_049376 [Cirrhinus mrigala]|uniref:Uncharacterized protein n=1 Tax=Cirrhinus mrigala TaxID=683832 RepID=A0ABD0N0S3_CIRMR